MQLILEQPTAGDEVVGGIGAGWLGSTSFASSRRKKEEEPRGIPGRPRRSGPEGDAGDGNVGPAEDGFDHPTWTGARFHVAYWRKDDWNWCYLFLDALIGLVAPLGRCLTTAKLLRSVQAHGLRPSSFFQLRSCHPVLPPPCRLTPIASAAETRAAGGAPLAVARGGGGKPPAAHGRDGSGGAARVVRLAAGVAARGGLGIVQCLCFDSTASRP